MSVLWVSYPSSWYVTRGGHHSWHGVVCHSRLSPSYSLSRLSHSTVTLLCHISCHIRHNDLSNMLQWCSLCHIRHVLSVTFVCRIRHIRLSHSSRIWYEVCHIRHVLSVRFVRFVSHIHIRVSRLSITYVMSSLAGKKVRGLATRRVEISNPQVVF